MASPNLSSSEPLQPIMGSERRFNIPRWLIAGGLGILLAGGGFFLWRSQGSRGNNASQGAPGVAVEVEAVQIGRVQDVSEFLGSLEAETGVVLQPEVSGRVIQIYVTEGDRVSPGNPIALISPDRALAEVTAAQASVTAAQAARDSAAASLRSLEANRVELQAELALQRDEYDRTATLVEQGALPEQELDFVSRDLEVAQANLASADQEISAARASLNQAGATLAEAAANRNAIQENLDDRTVEAPIAGIVGDLEVKLGAYVTPNSVITSITENNILELDLEIPMELRDRLNLGLPVELIANDGESVLASGSVTFISPQTDASTQTVLVKAQFENPEGRLQDSQRVEARIIWSQDVGVLVPTSAVTRIGGETFVYVAEAGDPEELPSSENLPPDTPVPDQVARLRSIELGDIQGNNYEVLTGLEPGESIVVSGILNLQDGTPILPQAAEETQSSQVP